MRKYLQKIAFIIILCFCFFISGCSVKNMLGSLYSKTDDQSQKKTDINGIDAYSEKTENTQKADSIINNTTKGFGIKEIMAIIAAIGGLGLTGTAGTIFGKKFMKSTNEHSIIRAMNIFRGTKYEDKLFTPEQAVIEIDRIKREIKKTFI